MTEEQDQGEPPAGEAEARPVHLHAQAAGQGRVYQAGRDQHVHYGQGTRTRTYSEGSEDAECPYPGLASFGRDQARWFRGREALTSALVDTVDRRLRTGGVQIVIGPSGAGKSSLLRAGLLARLAQGALPGSAPWRQILLTPMATPADTLDAALGPDPGGDVMTVDAGGDVRTVVVVDQFEELFTLCPDKAERQVFIDRLSRLAAATDEPPSALVVVGVRADFYAACLEYPQLAESVNHALVVTAMTADQLREAIVHPAQDVGLQIEPGLVEILLRDLGAEGGGRAGYLAGRLPHLAYALRRSWQVRHGSTLTVEGYESTGGIESAIADTAERIYRGLDERGRTIARALFLRLVRVGENTPDSCRRLALDDLVGTGLPQRAADAVIDAFTGERLLAREQDGHRDDVEITHEALIRGWPTLQVWVETDRTELLVRQRLAEDAATWRASGEDTAYLYIDSRLAAATELERGPKGAELTSTERGFVIAATHRARRRTRVVRAVIATLTALFLLAAAAGVVAVLQNQQVTRQRDTAISRQAADASEKVADSSLAAQLSLAAYRIAPTPEARGALLSALSRPVGARMIGHTGPVELVAFRRDGRVLASAASDSTARLWDVSDPARPKTLGVLKGHKGSLIGVAFSPDGRTVATASNDATARLWDVSEPTAPRTVAVLRKHRERVRSVAFAPDGALLATASDDGTTGIWDLSDRTRPRFLAKITADAGFPTVRFGPDSRTMAVSSRAGRAELWDLRTPEHPRRKAVLDGHSGSVTSVAFSSDGRILATASVDTTVRLWDATADGHARRLGTVRGHTALVYDAAFSPDNRTLATASADQTARLWDIADPRSPRPLSNLTGFTNTVTGVAFRPDGQVLATSSADGTVRAWNVSSPAHVADRALLTTSSRYVSRVAYSPDGQLLASTGDDGTAMLWDASDPARALSLATLKGHREEVSGIAFAPNGRRLITSSSDSTAVLWDIADPRHPTVLSRLRGHANAVQSVTFGPDGRLAATTGRDGWTILWDLSQPRHPREASRLGPRDNWINATAFTPDGRTIAVGSGTGAVSIWDIADTTKPERLAVLRAHDNALTDAKFDPTGKLLATSSNDGTTRLWNLARPTRPDPVATLRGHSNTVHGVDFSPDGATLATASLDSSVRLWNIAQPSEPTLRAVISTGTAYAYDVRFSPKGDTLATADGYGHVILSALDLAKAENYVCARAGMAITRAEWAQYVPDLPYAPPCGT
ncbi:WD40 repeat domain-containing protein [Streptomyces sp. NPDC047070]|uniref:WD40 repeat domain-containing protein n=1 Tax=Streptomyces sp. NPDC047070 TaxID=3154923 RepID=UPI0034561BDD